MGVPFKFGRIAAKEQSSSWGTAESSFANANYLDAQLTSPPTPIQDSEAAEILRADVYAPTRVAGGKGPTEFSISMPAHGFSTATPSGEATEHVEALLIRSVLGAAAQDGYHASDITSGGTVSLVQLTANAADEEVGHAMLVPLSSGHSVCWAKTGDTAADTYAPILDLSAAPATSGAILGSNTIYSATTQPTPFTFEWLGSTGNVAWRFWDAVVPSATLVLETGKQPRWDITIRALNWTDDGSGGAPSAEALTNQPQMPVCISSNGFRCTMATGEQKITRVTVSMTMDTAIVPDSSSTEGKGRFLMTDRAVTAEVVAAALGTGESTLNDPSGLLAPGATAAAVQIDANTTPGRSLSVLIPGSVPTETSTMGTEEEILTITTKVECSLYTSDTSTGSVTAPGNTSFRIAYM